MQQTIRVGAEEMKEVFEAVLLEHGFSETRAQACAGIFLQNSLEGVYTHGVNRFPRFVQYLQKGFIRPEAVPLKKGGFGGIEQWNGSLGPGPLNAVHATDRAMELAGTYGLGCVALSNTNHWMRGGYYGWHAARKGFAFIGWTNTTSNMPAWNAVDNRLGNNPLVLALPFEENAIVLDMAQSQFSFGTMEGAADRGEVLPVPGGYDASGNLTVDPSAILKGGRALSIGYWKGSGLSLLLDLLAVVLSGGLSTHDISKQEAEYGVSQVFLALDLGRLGPQQLLAERVRDVIRDYVASIPVSPHKSIRYPGQRALQTAAENRERGIPVLQKTWDEILHLHQKGKEKR